MLPPVGIESGKTDFHAMHATVKDHSLFAGSLRTLDSYSHAL